MLYSVTLRMTNFYHHQARAWMQLESIIDIFLPIKTFSNFNFTADAVGACCLCCDRQECLFPS